MKGKSVCKVIGESFGAFGKLWAVVLGGLVLSVGSMFGLMLFPLFGFFLSYFAMGFLCVGQKKFVLGRLDGKNLPVETVFSSFKICVQAFALKTIIILYSALWGILLIVPGIICLLNYSFASFIMAENEGLDALTTLEKSKSLVYGYRSKVLVLALFALVMFLAFGAVGFGITALIGLFTTLPVWAIVTITVGLALVGLALVVMPFYEISMAKIYIEAKNSEEKPKRKTKTA